MAVIALSTDKLIALSKAKMIAILKFNQKDNGDRTHFSLVIAISKKLTLPK